MLQPGEGGGVKKVSLIFLKHFAAAFFFSKFHQVLYCLSFGGFTKIHEIFIILTIALMKNENTSLKADSRRADRGREVRVQLEGVARRAQREQRLLHATARRRRQKVCRALVDLYKSSPEFATIVFITD